MKKLMIAVGVSVLLGACAGGMGMSGSGSSGMSSNPMVGGAAMFPSKNIIQNAVNSKDHTTLVAAVKAAGLVETLEGKGPFTVFAPTNAAFSAALTELGVSKADLLANKTLLTQVLTYHVVPGLVLKADVPLNTPITTLQGDSFSINASLAITDQRARRANITTTDVLTSNGVIHVIDKVILPRP